MFSVDIQKIYYIIHGMKISLKQMQLLSILTPKSMEMFMLCVSYIGPLLHVDHWHHYHIGFL